MRYHCKRVDGEFLSSRIFLMCKIEGHVFSNSKPSTSSSEYLIYFHFKKYLIKKKMWWKNQFEVFIYDVRRFYLIYFCYHEMRYRVKKKRMHFLNCSANIMLFVFFFLEISKTSFQLIFIVSFVALSSIKIKSSFSWT